MPVEVSKPTKALRKSLLLPFWRLGKQSWVNVLLCQASDREEPGCALLQGSPALQPKGHQFTLESLQTQSLQLFSRVERWQVHSFQTRSLMGKERIKAGPFLWMETVIWTTFYFQEAATYCTITLLTCRLDSIPYAIWCTKKLISYLCILKQTFKTVTCIEFYRPHPQDGVSCSSQS